MSINLLIGITVVLSAVFWVFGYALDIIRASQISPTFIFIDIVYLIASLFFLAYAGLSLYRELQREKHLPNSGQLGLII